MNNRVLLIAGIFVSSLGCSLLTIVGDKNIEISPEYKIVYAADQWLSRNIYLMYPDGSNSIKLTGGLGIQGYGSPSWSPDGSKIAFSGLLGLEGEDDIFTMNADGSDLIKLTDDPGRDYDFVWSPDGEQIAFVSKRVNDRGDIFVVNVDGTGLRQLTHADERSVDPAWSPDGSRILFDFDYEVAVMNSDGSNLQVITQLDDGSSKRPAWSPGGNQIAFIANTDFEDRTWSQLFIAQADGSRITQLTSSATEHVSPVWSPSGDQIALMISEQPSGKFYPWVINSDGSNLHKVSDIWAFREKVVWSPDGSKIIFSGADEDVEWDIYIIDLDRELETRLTDTNRFEGDPDWRE